VEQANVPVVVVEDGTSLAFAKDSAGFADKLAKLGDVTLSLSVYHTDV
jgi:hypothetical protein